MFHWSWWIETITNRLYLHDCPMSFNIVSYFSFAASSEHLLSGNARGHFSNKPFNSCLTAAWITVNDMILSPQFILMVEYPASLDSGCQKVFLGSSHKEPVWQISTRTPKSATLSIWVAVVSPEVEENAGRDVFASCFPVASAVQSRYLSANFNSLPGRCRNLSTFSSKIHETTL